MYNACFMATGPGSIHTRRVQMTGGATFTVSIPKEWASHHAMEAKDGLKMDWRPSGALRLTPAHEQKPKRAEMTLDVNRIPVASLVDHLVAAYIASANRIKLVSKDGFTRDHKSRIKRFLRITTGFEIMDENEKMIELLNILGTGDTFASGFLRGWLRGESLETCALWGNANGALTVTRQGCSPSMASLTELQYFIDHFDQDPQILESPELLRLYQRTVMGQPRRHPIFVLAFDHRTQFQQTCGELELPETK